MGSRFGPVVATAELGKVGTHARACMRVTHESACALALRASLLVSECLPA